MSKFFLWFFYIVISSAVIVFIALTTTQKTFSQHSAEAAVVPIPDYLYSAKNNEVTSLNLWSPLMDNVQPSIPINFQLTAKEALLYDLSTNKLLFGKNIHQRLAMASLTKIMTAVIALDNPKADDKYIVDQNDIVGEDSMGLDSGEVLSQSDLLYGLILHSGNDAAETLATNYPLGRTQFIKAMNNKAKTLGLFDTHFTNPTGLEGDGPQYTSAFDLLLLTHYALTYQTFTTVVKTFDYTIAQTATHKEYDLENETNLLTSYPGVEGVKTGYTPEAGYCLVTYLNFQNHKIIGIILGSDDRRDEMRDLLDYSLQELGITPPPNV